MTSDKARKRQARALAAAEGISYTAALRRVAVTVPAPAAAIEPHFLAPYPDELIRPDDAAPGWKPPTVDELGWRALPADATPAQRARTESLWRPLTAQRPCRCAGRCLHGSPCEPDGGPEACPGRMVHFDRLAAPGQNTSMWADFHACDDCGDDVEGFVELPEVPWGRPVSGVAVQYEGVRIVDFDDGDDGYDGGCGDCGAGPGYRCTCDDPWCGECGADSHYSCSCYEPEYA
ncbi:hypothetical protein [Catellatospora sp. NPDC049609]|uniref:hypothetical protein n=1 Tax=Catellatospora sp. NPDC049609 TaxID=3155505 RepID=UPI0034311ED8